jgi:hypothetical protein
MTDQEGVSRTRTDPIGGGNSRGLVTFILGLMVMTVVFGLALVLDRYGEASLDRSMSRDQAKQPPVPPPTKPK